MVESEVSEETRLNLGASITAALVDPRTSRGRQREIGEFYIREFERTGDWYKAARSTVRYAERLDSDLRDKVLIRKLQATRSTLDELLR